MSRLDPYLTKQPLFEHHEIRETLVAFPKIVPLLEGQRYMCHAGREFMKNMLRTCGWPVRDKLKFGQASLVSFTVF